MKRTLTFMSCCVLMACTAQEHPNIEAARAAVVANLKDPDSVQFRNVRVVAVETSAGPTDVVCGEFNAKNGFGGYAGYEKFAFSATGDLLMRSAFPEAGRPIIDRGIAAYCSGRLPDESEIHGSS